MISGLWEHLGKRVRQSTLFTLSWAIFLSLLYIAYSSNPSNYRFAVDMDIEALQKYLFLLNTTK